MVKWLKARIGKVHEFNKRVLVNRQVAIVICTLGVITQLSCACMLVLGCIRQDPWLTLWSIILGNVAWTFNVYALSCRGIVLWSYLEERSFLSKYWQFILAGILLLSSDPYAKASSLCVGINGLWSHVVMWAFSGEKTTELS